MALAHGLVRGDSMIHKIIHTGLLLSALLLIPGALKDVVDPNGWIKAFIVVGGMLGLLMSFVGMFFLIWA